MSVVRGTVYTDNLIWDVNTMSYVPWDGSLSTGDLTIGTVDQGAPGAVAWPVKVIPSGGTTSHLVETDADNFTVDVTGQGTALIDVPNTYSGFLTVYGYTGSETSQLRLQNLSNPTALATSINGGGRFRVNVAGFTTLTIQPLSVGASATITVTTIPAVYGDLVVTLAGALVSDGKLNISDARTHEQIDTLTDTEMFAFRMMPPRFKMAIDYDVDSNPIYIGITSQAGSAKSDAVWQIRKLVFSSSNLTDTQYPSGSTNFEFVWDDRLTYTFS